LFFDRIEQEFTDMNDIKAFIEKQIAEISPLVKDKKVLLALSGGVDSSVCAALMSKICGRKLYCIFVDHGFMRKNEGDEVEEVFGKQFDLNFTRVNCAGRYLARLRGITDPEQKRKIIGAEFINVFEEEAAKIGKVDFLVQGTIYPDIVESEKGHKAHHNVGGLPERMNLALIEPLKTLYKNEVRQVGLELGLPGKLVFRQPFPGPGLAVRVIGGITESKLNILRDADAIFREEIAAAGLDNILSQYFAIITDTRSVGVRGDARTYGHILALRAVITNNFMTAEWADIPAPILRKVGERIAAEVSEVTRVVYDITSKPPATIEWE